MMVLLFLFSGATCKFINQNITSLVSAFRVTRILVTVFSQINRFVMNNIYCYPFVSFLRFVLPELRSGKVKLHLTR